MDASPVVSQLTSGAIVVYGMEMLKKSKYFPWLSRQTATANRLMASLLAGLTAIGIHMSYDSASGTLILTGLGLSAVLHGIWHWAQAFATQQIIYDGVAKATPVVVVGDSPPKASSASAGN